ncbi:hypothetical protein GNX18_11125 [Microbulbifer sp. SH-1]|uniref:hypothetical protein n=1 Tax=Microbulbifer sp. SH-1 TaxID=2681547 RepID=UPI00140A0BBA|nr:hypothetical protein [Microbulbifer sp. SH-1]QIL90244.1 hypothetical protein GNX18_11125 [Microbulbifer sp. SH-1]
MNTVILCNRNLSSPVIQQACNLNLQQFSELHCPTPRLAKANTPYLLNGHNDAQGKRIQTLLAPAHIARPVTELSLTFGEDNTIAIAAMMEQLKDYNIALTGASTSIYGERINGFAKSVKEYQIALLTYRDAKLSGASNHGLLKQQAHAAFMRMQRTFNAELNNVTSHIRSRRGSPLTSAERGTNIASSNRNAAKLQFSSEIEAHKLVRFSQYTKLLGNGLAVVDFGVRAGKIHSSYKAGGDWERDLFIESSRFAASAGAGVIAAKAGIAIFMFATPVGWAAVIAGGLLIAGTAVVSIAADRHFEKNGELYYDNIMGALSK